MHKNDKCPRGHATVKKVKRITDIEDRIKQYRLNQDSYTYKTQRSDFGGQRGSGTNLSTGASHVH